MTIAPPPRFRISGTASRDARTAGNRVWSSASCHSSSDVPTISVPLARPTLLTRMSSPPNKSTVRAMTVSTPAAVETSATTGNTSVGRCATERSSAAASLSDGSPLAQIVTRHPSWARARALANPNPLLEPVTMATLPERPRSMNGRMAGRKDGRIPATSSSAPPGEIVEGPVERPVNDLEGVRRKEFLFGRQELGADEGENRAFDRASGCEGRAGAGGVRGGELLLAPRKNRVRLHLVGLTRDVYALRPGDAFVRHLGELCLQLRAGKGLASQAPAANRASPEGEIDAGIVKLRQDRLLDLIQRQRPAGYAMGEPVERAGNLTDAFRRILRRPALNRIVIDDRPQHDRVVGVQPEGQLRVARLLSDRGPGQRGDECVEARPVAFERAVVDLPVTDVGVEDEIDASELGIGLLRARWRDTRQREGGDDTSPSTQPWTRHP